jgi:hypothetical protein
MQLFWKLIFLGIFFLQKDTICTFCEHFLSDES